jgi:hypothetical protein
MHLSAKIAIIIIKIISIKLSWGLSGLLPAVIFIGDWTACFMTAIHGLKLLVTECDSLYENAMSWSAVLLWWELQETPQKIIHKDAATLQPCNIRENEYRRPWGPVDRVTWGGSEEIYWQWGASRSPFKFGSSLALPKHIKAKKDVTLLAFYGV